MADELTGSADAIQQHSQQIRSKDIEETMQ
jgi:hypothetical protein